LRSAQTGKKVYAFQGGRHLAGFGAGPDLTGLRFPQTGKNRQDAGAPRGNLRSAQTGKNRQDAGAQVKYDKSKERFIL